MRIERVNGCTGPSVALVIVAETEAEANGLAYMERVANGRSTFPSPVDLSDVVAAVRAEALRLEAAAVAIAANCATR